MGVAAPIIMSLASAAMTQYNNQQVAKKQDNILAQQLQRNALRQQGQWQAWIDAAVPQCGYCHNGQVMTAAALLNADPSAAPADVAAAMDSVICRCGTQRRIAAAIDLAQQMLRVRT